MPKFTVSVERTETYSTTFTIEAESEDAAYEVGRDLAENGKDQDGKSLEWEYQDEEYEVTSVEEEPSDEAESA